MEMNKNNTDVYLQQIPYNLEKEYSVLEQQLAAYLDGWRGIYTDSDVDRHEEEYADDSDEADEEQKVRVVSDSADHIQIVMSSEGKGYDFVLSTGQLTEIGENSDGERVETPLARDEAGFAKLHTLTRGLADALTQAWTAARNPEQDS